MTCLGRSLRSSCSLAFIGTQHLALTPISQQPHADQHCCALNHPSYPGLHVFMQEAGTMAAADAKEAASKRTSGIGLWPFTQRQSMDTGAPEDSVTGAGALP